MNNFIIAVTSCEPYLKTRIPVIQQYCLKGIPHFIFTGKCNKQFDNHIPLDCLDDYFSLRSKTFELFKWFLTTDYDYLVKCDDDSFLNYEEIVKLSPAPHIGGFLQFSESKSKRKHHFEYVLKLTNREQDLSYFDDITFDFKYAEGGCYILDKDSVRRIVEYEQNNTIPKIISEDITVGYIVHLLKIPIVDLTIPLEWYDVTTFHFHPCKEILFPLLSSKKTLPERLDILKRFSCLNLHYRKCFDLK